MKRKILLACSLLLIVAVLSTGILAGCAGETTTETVTKTNTSTVTTTAQGVTTTVTATTTAAGATVTQTVGAGETATVTVTQTATTTKTVSVGGDGDGLITVMSPIVANHYVERIPLGPRLDSLEGKSIYLIDVNWGSGDMHGGYSFLTVVAEWLEDEYNCTTKVVKQAGSYFAGDPDLFAEAGENADAVIYGVSG
jgi:hypothetical protein